MPKSSTDLHWNRRALAEEDEARVNIHDTVQRDLELARIVLRHKRELRQLAQPEDRDEREEL